MCVLLLIILLKSSTNSQNELGRYHERGYNFAGAEAGSEDLARQARELVAAMEADTRLNMNTHWKLVSNSY